jgi:hypothetical protein
LQGAIGVEGVGLMSAANALDEVKPAPNGTAAKAAFLPKCPNKLKLSLEALPFIRFSLVNGSKKF